MDQLIWKARTYSPEDTLQRYSIQDYQIETGTRCDVSASKPAQRVSQYLECINAKCIILYEKRLCRENVRWTLMNRGWDRDIVLEIRLVSANTSKRSLECSQLPV